MTVSYGSAVTILNGGFEEIRLLSQIAAGHKLHSGPIWVSHQVVEKDYFLGIIFITAPTIYYLYHFQ
jgi:hypothetical protein